MLRRALRELRVAEGEKNVLVIAAFEEVEHNPKWLQQQLQQQNRTGGAADGDASAAAAAAAASPPPPPPPPPPLPKRNASAGAPLDKAELLRRVSSGDIVGFASREYDAGHRCDHVQTFLQAHAPFTVEYEFGCEPYTVLPRSMAHWYEERFVGYGKDRVSWNYELAAKGAVQQTL